MSLTFIHSGLQTSLQDEGRKGFLAKGISRSGAMDRLAMHLANWLVDNEKHTPVIEVTLIGPEIVFHLATTVAVTGAHFSLTLNGQPQPNNQIFQVKPNDRLTFGKLSQGCRAYLACSASWDIPYMFGSYSTHLTAGFGGFHGRAFKDGDSLKMVSTRCVGSKILPDDYQLGFSGHYLVRCVPSVETHLFSRPQIAAYQAQGFQVAPESNRMGIRLIGEPVQHGLADIVSSGLLPGSIQVPPSGLPIIAAADAQTIGGYPRIGHVIEADMPVIGQLKASDTVTFLMIDEAEARQLYQEQQAMLDILDEPHAHF